VCDIVLISELPWNPIKLNNGEQYPAERIYPVSALTTHSLDVLIGPLNLNAVGKHIPNIAFGTFLLGKGRLSTDRIDQARTVCFNHIDTAQAYKNEAEAGLAIRQSRFGARGYLHHHEVFRPQWVGRLDVD